MASFIPLLLPILVPILLTALILTLPYSYTSIQLAGGAQIAGGMSFIYLSMLSSTPDRELLMGFVLIPMGILCLLQTHAKKPFEQPHRLIGLDTSSIDGMLTSLVK